MRIYTVEEAAEIIGVSQGNILDATRTGELVSYFDTEPSFPVPYTDKSIRHRSLIGISADALDSIHPDLEHRWQLLSSLSDVEDEDDARHYVERALLAWYGAALDDPSDREAAGVIECLTSFAGYLGLKRDGTMRKRSQGPTLAAAA